MLETLMDFSVFETQSLAPFLAMTAVIMFLSFFFGTVIKGLFRINHFRWLTFATPIGFCAYMGILQIGYTYITYQNTLQGIENAAAYISYTKWVTILLLIASCIGFYFIWEDFKQTFHWKNLLKLPIAFLIFAAIIRIYLNVEVIYRLDDINFYSPFINDRLTTTNSLLPIYIYQGYYTFLAVVKEWLADLCSILGYDMPADIVYALWMPSVLSSWVVSVAITDFEGFIEEKIKCIPIAWVVWAAVTVITMLDYWYFQTPYIGNTLRRIPLLMVIPMMDAMIKENKWYYSIPASLAIGGAVAYSSSCFFLLMMLLYAYTIYAMLMKHEHWLEELMIMAFFPFLFAVVYMPALMNPVKYLYIFMAIVIAVLAIFKLNWIEGKLRWVAVGILVIVPIGLILIQKMGYPSQEMFADALLGREFFDAIGTNDQVPDLVQVGTASGMFDAIANAFQFKSNLDVDGTKIQAVHMIFWVLLLIASICMIKSKEWTVFMPFVIVITFYNPFVYKFIGVYLTASAYCRITDLLFNPVVMSGIFISIGSLGTIGNKLYIRYPVYCALAFLFAMIGMIRYQTFFVPNVITEETAYYDDFNPMYKTRNSYIDTVQKFENYLKNDPDVDVNVPGGIKVVSQIYGAQFFTKNLNIKNILEDRFAHIVAPESEIERTFARRYPGIELDEENVDFRHSCSLAFGRGVGYVLIDGQFNAELQFGLWPCSNLKDDNGIWKIIKMDPVYWDETLHKGYTLKYLVSEDARNTEGIDYAWYKEQEMDVPQELPEDKEEQEAALAKLIQ